MLDDETLKDINEIVVGVGHKLNGALNVNAISMLEYRMHLSKYIDIDPENIPECTEQKNANSLILSQSAFTSVVRRGIEPLLQE